MLQHGEKREKSVTGNENDKSIKSYSAPLRSLSKGVFERRRSTGSEAFSLFTCLDGNKFVLLSFFSLVKTIYSRVSTKPLPNDAKSPLPVDIRRSKTLLLKLPTIYRATVWVIFNYQAICNSSKFGSVFNLFLQLGLISSSTVIFLWLPQLPLSSTAATKLGFANSPLM